MWLLKYYPGLSRTLLQTSKLVVVLLERLQVISVPEVKMLPTGAAAAPGRGTERSGEEGRRSLGVQEWADGSRYEGEFENGLKHGRGRFTWTDGEVLSIIKDLAKYVM